MTEQTENLERVNDAIAAHVIKFYREHINREFFGGELFAYVCQRQMVAPDSPRRIMSDLKNRGIIDYKVLNRRKSLYLAIPICEQMELF